MFRFYAYAQDVVLTNHNFTIRLTTSKYVLLNKEYLCKLCLKAHLLELSFANCSANILIRNIWVKHKSWRNTTINQETLWIRHTYVLSIFIHAFLPVQMIVATCCVDWCMLYHYPSWICTSHMCTILPCRGTCWWYYFACRNNLISWKLYAYSDNKSYGTLLITNGICHLANSSQNIRFFLWYTNL